MSDPAHELKPIADVFNAAIARGQINAPPEPDEAADAAAAREEDIASIKRAFKKGALKMARSVGKAMGWTRDEVDALFKAPDDEAPARPAGGRVRAVEEAGGGGGAPPPDAPDGSDDGSERRWKRKKRPIMPLPEDCPVTPLGTLGSSYHYLNPLGEHVSLTKHGADDLRSLFVREVEWLWNFRPKFRESDGEHTGWKADQTADSLIDACGRRGIFDPSRRLRGVGAWKGDDGSLVLHCGDAVWLDGQWRKPGYHGEYVYPGADKVPRPAEGAASDAAGRQLLRLFDSWNFRDGLDHEEGRGKIEIGDLNCSVAALTLLGWQASALVGGALDWRPAVVLTGDAGTGKSTLQKAVGHLMGASLVQSSDATSAGIYQSVGYSSRAAAIDEAENDPHSLKMKNMVDLVRQSASGGSILRGSNDAKFKHFHARSSFLLSSIILPPFGTQDLTRIAWLELKPLRKEAPPSLEMGMLAALGRQLRRRILDGWARFPDTLEAYRMALARGGHDARSCDQHGALLAMADLCLFDGPPDNDTTLELASYFPWVMGEKSSNAESMLDWLLSMPIDAFRGGNRVSIGQLVTDACGIRDHAGHQGNDPVLSIAALKGFGIFVDGAGDKATVTLPNVSAGLAGLFDRTSWSTRSGAATSGWQQAMSRLPGAKPVNSRRFGGRGWSVGARAFLRLGEGE